jgi:phage repressor protein C with HTH and peptisase S24 domain
VGPSRWSSTFVEIGDDTVTHARQKVPAAGSIGGIVRDRRRAADLTLAQLAQLAALSPAYLSMLENDRLKRPPSRDALGRLERALGLPAGRLGDAADVARAPDSVRQRLAETTRRADRAGDLAGWLKDAAQRGVTLDRLLRSGALGRAIDRALEPSIEQAPPRRLGPRVPLINRVAAGYPADFTDLDYPARIADDYVDAPGVEDPDAFAAAVVGNSMLPDYREGDVVIFSPLADVIDGCDCFARLEPDHQTTFKRVFFEDDGRRVRLQPLNPAFEPRTIDREQVAGLYRAVSRYSRL